MTTYVALLRGINLGPARRVEMPALRELASGLGYRDVATHLSTGNLILSTDQAADDVRTALEQGIQQAFGLDVDVMVRTAEEMATVVRANPWPDADPSRVTVAFLAAPAPAGVEDRLAARASADEPFLVAGLEVYVLYGRGQANSRLAASIADVLGVSATVRNLRTTAKLAELTAG